MMRLRILSIFLVPVSASLDAASTWEPFVAVERTEAADYEDVSGGPSVSYTEWVAGVTAFQGNRKGQISLDASYGFLNADWSGGGFAGDSAFVQFEEVETLGLSVMRTGLLEGNWSYAVLLGAESARVTKGPLDEASFSDSLSYSIGAGLSYQVNADLRLGFVTLYQDRMAGVDEDWIAFPSIFWRINDNWTLETRRGLVLTWNAGGERLEHEVFFSGTFHNREWHLGESGSTESGYEEESYAFGIGYVLGLESGFSFEVEGQYAFGREVTIWQDGRKAARSDLENGFLYGFRIGYTF